MVERPTPKSSASVAPTSANVGAPEIDAGTRAVPKQWHVFARMVGALRRQVVAMIRGDEAHFVVSQPAAAGEPRVEMLGARPKPVRSLRWPYS